MSKPFFYRVTAADFAIAVMQIPDGQHKVWLHQLAEDMVRGVGTLDFSRRLIEDVEMYRKKQAEAGAKGGRPSKKATLTDPLPTLSDPIPTPEQPKGNSSSSIISSTETKEKATSSSSEARMMTSEFSTLYHQAFGNLLPGLLNNDVREICQQYTHERISQAFKVTAEKGGKTFDYFKKVLKNDKPNKKEGILDDFKRSFFSEG